MHQEAQSHGHESCTSVGFADTFEWESHNVSAELFSRIGYGGTSVSVIVGQCGKGWGYRYEGFGAYRAFLE